MSLLRIFVVFLLLASCARAGMNADTAFTEQGKTDFDTFLHLLNPYGTWSRIGDRWAYTPLDHEAPYTHGRWLYTEYGWYWKGTHPHSWATEHYGFWKRSADKVWSWYPGPYWLPQIVEMRATNSYIGWRTGEVDDSGNFVEAPIDRFSKFDEWSFVTLAQFANPITSDTIALPGVVRTQLEDSTDCRHTYMTYREIDRPGPHPADFADLSKDGGMLAPKTIEDEAQAQTSPPVVTNIAPATNSPAAHMTGTNTPTLVGNEVDPSADTRKVKYWITMSLPTFWTKPPADAKAEELYIYHPDLYQDQDGIERRITLWFNPNARTALKDVFKQNPVDGAASTSGGPASPAVPVSTDNAPPARSPFASPLDSSYHGSSTASTSKSTNTPPKAPAPSGLK